MDNAVTQQRTVMLPTGELNIRYREKCFPLDHLIGLAARNNPKRGFLFVSRVLGKHIESKPSEMHRVHHYLAKKLGAVASCRALLIGMAETATGLGQGIYEAYLQHSGPRRALYSHTTRYFLSGLESVAFEEAHSHAVEQYLYVPAEPNRRSCFLNAQTLVLIDDEITTGNTFCSLIEVYRRLNPGLQSVVIVTLLNLLSAERRRSIEKTCGLRVNMLAALDGEASFTMNTDYRYQTCSDATGNGTCKRNVLGIDTGRLGVQDALPLDRSALAAITHEWSPGDRVLVLGTGEFMHLPYRIGYALEQCGWRVGVQSTTRSPILIGGAIESALIFKDNYLEGIPNYL
ncbi:MAG: phosphoribosyltransferase family protein, partial [Methylococcaceae bacterium]|nr:phosphoribosyltransferase family protein [Methylococcaceae bacterium]